MANIAERLFEAALTARSRAYAPYSSFPVGAAVLTESGLIFSGCNVEISAYPNGLCAESGAIAAMALAGERRITDVLVIGGESEPITPCGACRQRLHEFAVDGARVHLADLKGPTETVFLEELLPRAFGPRDLEGKRRDDGRP